MNKQKMMLLIHTLFCLFLLLFRQVWTGDGHYNFMAVNLLLAWIPLFFSLALKRTSHPALKAVFFLGWLLFFPNSAYVFTDLLHLNDVKSHALWLDVFVLFSFGLNALLVSFISLRMMHLEILKKIHEVKAWAVVSVILLFTSVGIYMGRFLRFNSWDFFFDPASVIRLTWERYNDPMTHPVALPFTVLLTLFLLINYVLFWEVTRESGMSKT